MSTYQTIIFDFFDVLYADYYHAWLRAHNLQNEGEAVAINRAVDLEEITLSEFYRRLGLLTGQTADEVRTEQQASAHLNNDTLDIVRAVRRAGFTTGLISNAPRTHLRPILQEYSLEPLFDAIIISGEVGMIKPDPNIFLHALNYLHSEPATTIFIDDNPRNVDAAAKLGITPITFTGATQLWDKLKKLRVLQ